MENINTEKTSMRSASHRHSPSYDVQDKQVLGQILEKAKSLEQGLSANNSRNVSPTETETAVGLMCKFPRDQKITEVMDDQMSDNTNKGQNSPLSPRGNKNKPLQKKVPIQLMDSNMLGFQTNIFNRPAR